MGGMGGFLNLMGADGWSPGGIFGTFIEPDKSEGLLVHELDHIRRQQEEGISWHFKYAGEFISKLMLSGSFENAYKYHSQEILANEAAEWDVPEGELPLSPLINEILGAVSYVANGITGERAPRDDSYLWEELP